MKLGNITKGRVRLESVGSSWLLFVDQKSVISTQDRHWLRRFAVEVRKSLDGELIR